MSHNTTKPQSITVAQILRKKADSERISMVTCYDAAFGRIVEASPIDMVLVGDSLGNVLLGHSSTIPVTMDDMVHHTAAVTRVVHRPLVIADMPFFSYVDVDTAVRNAGRLVQQGGAHGVKLEGGAHICPQVQAIARAGVPVVGHLGLTPQSVHGLSGYKVQAKQEADQKKLIEDALALQEAGAFCIVLEMIPAKLSAKVTSMLRIPTIGIGAGGDCNGQVLVLHDLLGFDATFNPKFLKKYADLSQIIGNALFSYDKEVKTGQFPEARHSFGD